MLRNRPVKREHHGRKVVFNPTLESVRKEECLCVHCALDSGTCRGKRSLDKLRVLHSVELAVTGCPDFVELVV